MCTKFTTQHTSIRSCYYNLITRIIKSTHKTLPPFYILYLIKIICMLLAKKFNKTLLKFLKIIKFKINQTFIVEIEEEVFFYKPVPNLLHQYRFATTTYTRNNKNFGCLKPFVSYISLYITLIRSMQYLLLLKYYLLK